jgi:hypothetical protein
LQEEIESRAEQRLGDCVDLVVDAKEVNKQLMFYVKWKNTFGVPENPSYSSFIL